MTVLRLRRRRARVWCQHCGAVTTLADLSVLRPVAQHLGGAAPRRPAPVEPAVHEVMPAAMLAWLTRQDPPRPADPSTVTAATLDRTTIYRLYREWDSHLAAEGAASGSLPAFSTVVGRTDDLCYHTEHVVASLRGVEPVSGAYHAALWQRVEHARRWLAQAPTTRCWLHVGVPPEGLASPPAATAAAAVRALESAAEPDPDLAQAARAAMFGTVGGPALGTLQTVYPREEMLRALRAYLSDGARPLREDALARLVAPPRSAR